MLIVVKNRFIVNGIVKIVLKNKEKPAKSTITVTMKLPKSVIENIIGLKDLVMGLEPKLLKEITILAKFVDIIKKLECIISTKILPITNWKT